MDCSHLEKKKAPKHLRAGKGHDYFHPATACFSLTTASLSTFGSYSFTTPAGYTPSLRKGKLYFGSSVPPTVSPPPTLHKAFWSTSVSLGSAGLGEHCLKQQTTTHCRCSGALRHLGSALSLPTSQATPFHLSTSFPKPTPTANIAISPSQSRNGWGNLTSEPELLPVFCTAEGFILTQHKSKHMLPYSLHPKCDFSPLLWQLNAYSHTLRGCYVNNREWLAVLRGP